MSRSDEYRQVMDYLKQKKSGGSVDRSEHSEELKRPAQAPDTTNVWNPKDLEARIKITGLIEDSSHVVRESRVEEDKSRSGQASLEIKITG